MLESLQPAPQFLQITVHSPREAAMTGGVEASARPETSLPQVASLSLQILSSRFFERAPTEHIAQAVRDRGSRRIRREKREEQEQRELGLESAASTDRTSDSTKRAYGNHSKSGQCARARERVSRVRCACFSPRHRRD